MKNKINKLGNILKRNELKQVTGAEIIGAATPCSTSPDCTKNCFTTLQKCATEYPNLSCVSKTCMVYCTPGSTEGISC